MAGRCGLDGRTIRDWAGWCRAGLAGAGTDNKELSGCGATGLSVCVCVCARERDPAPPGGVAQPTPRVSVRGRGGRLPVRAAAWRGRGCAGVREPRQSPAPPLPRCSPHHKYVLVREPPARRMRGTRCGAAPAAGPTGVELRG